MRKPEQIEAEFQRNRKRILEIGKRQRELRRQILTAGKSRSLRIVTANKSRSLRIVRG